MSRVTNKKKWTPDPVGGDKREALYRHFVCHAHPLMCHTRLLIRHTRLLIRHTRLDRVSMPAKRSA
jgi:hypothetical protein